MDKLAYREYNVANDTLEIANPRPVAIYLAYPNIKLSLNALEYT